MNEKLMNEKLMNEKLMNGFINIDKPRGMTSHDVVAIIRKELPKKTKVGHTGTLDPDATGVLPICVGKATRLAEYITESVKVYRGELTLGIVTDTDDATGSIISQADASRITLADVKALLPKYSGPIEQIPPMFSAIKVNGKKLYELARQGLEIERKPRKVMIYSLKIIDWALEQLNPKITMEVVCSSGTYIRSLFADLGKDLGVGAHMSALRRLAVGDFKLDASYSLAQVQELIRQADFRCFLPLQMAVRHLPVLILADDRAYDDVLHGRSLKVKSADVPVCSVETANGLLAAIGSVENGILKINKMLLDVK